MKTIFTLKVNLNPEEQFKVISEQLFNHYILKSSNSRYRFAEIEFYYFNQCPDKNYDSYYPDNNSLYGPPLEDATWKKVTSWKISHQDFVTHCFGNQAKSGYWYLHMFKNGTLKNGKYKGMDLTIGDEEESAYGGILIRALLNIDTDEYIYGPSKVVDTIIKDLGKKEIKEIIDILNLSADDATNKIHLIKEDLVPEKIFSCKRFGLTINKKKVPENAIEKQKEFLDKDYRFFIFPLKQHAGKEQVLQDWIKAEKSSSEDIYNDFRRRIKFLPKLV